MLLSLFVYVLTRSTAVAEREGSVTVALLVDSALLSNADGLQKRKLNAPGLLLVRVNAGRHH